MKLAILYLQTLQVVQYAEQGHLDLAVRDIRKAAMPFAILRLKEVNRRMVWKVQEVCYFKNV